MTLALAALLALPALAQRPTALERAGRYEEAAAAFEKDASRRPENLDKRKDLMWAYWNARRFIDARRSAERVLKTRADDQEALFVVSQATGADARERAPALWSRAAAAYRGERFEEAVALYVEVVALQPRDVPSLKDLMWAYWRLELIEEAMEAARQVLALRPADAEALMILRNGARILEERLIAALHAGAMDLITLKRYDAALALLRRLAAMRPARIGYQRAVVEVLIEAGRLDEALSAALALVKRFPRDAASWTVLGGLQVRMGDVEAGRKSLETALALDPGQWRAVLALAELLLREREFAAAERLLRPWEDTSVKGMARSLPWPMGQALFWQDRYAEALAWFSDAAQARPDKPDRAYYHAWAALKLGRSALGRAELAALSARGYEPAFAMLVDEAVARGDLERALALLAPSLRAPTWRDEGLVLRAAGLLQSVGRPEEAMALLSRFVSVLPESQGAWLQKGRLELDAGRLKAARASARAALRLNPAAREAALLQGAVARVSGNPARAERLAAGLLEREPMLPDNVLKAAAAAYETGRRRRARSLLRRWVSGNEGTALPVLLYHGLTTVEVDPLLAYPYHHRLSTFEDHMRALKEAGYTPVGVDEAAAWLAGASGLPPKPVLLTFDDGRSDSFKLADTVLKREGFKATMMTGVVFVEGNPYPSPAYASWKSLRAWKETGRWDLQSHGAFSHTRIPIDERGRRGLFLVNRQPGESPEEASARMDRDHALAKRRLAEETGAQASAFAYPEGAAGHTAAVSNAPASFELNRALSAKHYKLAFVQDPYGVNMRGRDPLLLSRVEPDNRWTGERLVRHLERASPLVAAYALELDWAARERDPAAYRWLSRLEELGAGPAEVLAKEAAIRYYAGDPGGALRLARIASEREDGKEAAALRDRIEVEDAPYLAPSYQYYRDDQGRRTWSLSSRVDLGRRGPWRPRAGYRRAEAVQAGGPAVSDDVPGAGADLRLAPGQVLSLDAEWHALGGAPDAPAADAALASLWPKGWSTRAELARTPLFTARALARGLRRRAADLSARWDGEPWAASARTRREWYSDENARTTLEAEASARVLTLERLTVRGVYRFVYDGARELSADYWTPQELKLHALGPDVSLSLSKNVVLKGRWLAARGKETIGEAGLYHQARAAVAVGWRKLDTVELGFDLNRAPRYRAVGASAQASVRLGP